MFGDTVRKNGFRRLMVVMCVVPSLNDSHFLEIFMSSSNSSRTLSTAGLALAVGAALALAAAPAAAQSTDKENVLACL
jgi:hypothetical protein